MNSIIAVRGRIFTQHPIMSFTFALLCMIVMLPFSGYAQFTSPIKVELVNQTSSSSEKAELEFVFEAPENVHIYSTEDKFLKLVTEESVGLGTADLILPKLKPFKNFDGAMLDVIEHDETVVVHIPFTGQAGEGWSFKGYLQYQGCSDTTCFPPSRKAVNLNGTIPSSMAGTPQVAQAAIAPPSVPPASKGLLLMLLGAFGAGLLLSLTPCVYPMIGITVAVIGGKDATKRQTILRTFAYVLGLSLVYAIIGVIVASVGSAAAAFFRSTWVLVPIGAIFVFLGLSMFDVFMLQTPSFISSRASRFKANGVAGSFLVGAVSAFVVGPCVSGPVLGLISYVATTGNRLAGFALFFALAWGMGLILFVAGTASTALPKSGEWMEKVKHLLGVVLIWAAFYFTRPLTGEGVFVAANIVAVALALQALGLLRFPEYTDRLKQTGRFALGVAILGISSYVFLPSAAKPERKDTIVLSEELASEKPVLLDFSASWCSICKEIERTTLKEPEVMKALEEYNFVKVDYDSNPDLVKQFGIIGPPAFIFVDKDGSINGEIAVTGETLKKRLVN
ncbi:hypothetical protein BVY04_01730 [bacterium M21]|nr:hypothetical protein BVY04_01730 [bacterium M21]